MVGQQVLPEFISVRFDPTMRTVGSTAASGHYAYDDQGVPARSVYAVKDGVLEKFLMSRAPIESFPSSNGHGRAQPGRVPVGRQSNLIVEASKQVTVEELRELLRETARAQDKPFGLVFEDIAGGFTFTGRSVPNAFTVLPVMVWRVYVDGRPDELVRGADLIGTPLTSFSSISAAADDMETFNGICGAESGSVPVSASSPSLLVEQIEVQKKEKSADRPPILPAPAAEEEQQKKGVQR
jgi:predicted Zn-dependent protease